MAKLSTVQAANTHRVIVFGPPKVGKTQLVGTLASEFKLIWFDLENGYNTLLKLPAQLQERIELIHIPDSKVFPIAVETMLKVFSGNTVQICDEHGKVGCALCKKDNKPYVEFNINNVPDDTIVVIDSLTQYTNSAIANITRNKPDDYKMQFDDWGNLRALVEKLLSCVQSASCSIVCISHEEEVEMEDGRKKIVPVCGSSKSSRNTAKYFDHVVYCEVKNKKHIAGSSTAYSNNILTGSRTDVTLENDEAPSLLTIFKSTGRTVAATPATNALSALKGMVKQNG